MQVWETRETRPKWWTPDFIAMFPPGMLPSRDDLMSSGAIDNVAWASKRRLMTGGEDSSSCDSASDSEAPPPAGAKNV